MRKRIEERGSYASVDTRRVAVEPCDACGCRALCTRGACPDCGLQFSTCERCERESGGRALTWQVEGHRRRAHGQNAKLAAKRDDVGHRRLHRGTGERRIVRREVSP